ncbi:MAG: thymidylate synthase [Deltaproteobacteria bacterium]|jgi:thymidylate synthase|nr:thymidylate synthase [Deltaproteobacteria bacterium]
MLDYQAAVKVRSLRVVNPLGTAALCTLWTPAAYVTDRLTEKAPWLLDPALSPLAVIGGLYGGGLKIMLRNLHHNPQIDTVILCGKDFSGAGEHLAGYFRGEYERTGKRLRYVIDLEGGGKESRELETVVVRGKRSHTNLDELLLPADFRRRPEVVELRSDAEAHWADRVRDFFASYGPKKPAPDSRPDIVPVPRLESAIFPAERAGGTLVADGIAEAWAGILFRLDRFGVPVAFRKGKERRELLNFKAVIRYPAEWDPDELARDPWNLHPEAVERYRNEISDPENRHEGIPYTYGSRIRSWFGYDMLERTARDLAGESDSRHAYVSLWDNGRDPDAADAPCLCSLFFRKIDGKVNLCATFRSHNVSRAWPLNCLGLVRLTELVCELANGAPDKREPLELAPGSLTVISLSLTLNEEDMPTVKPILDRFSDAPFRMAEDPCGYFRILADHAAGEIAVLHHAPTGDLLEEYRGKTPDELSKRIARNLAVSDLGHAMYLGSQLERAWYCLAKGLEFVQDKTRLA